MREEGDSIEKRKTAIAIIRLGTVVVLLMRRAQVGMDLFEGHERVTSLN